MRLKLLQICPQRPVCQPLPHHQHRLHREVLPKVHIQPACTGEAEEDSLFPTDRGRHAHRGILAVPEEAYKALSATGRNSGSGPVCAARQTPPSLVLSVLCSCFCWPPRIASAQGMVVLRPTKPRRLARILSRHGFAAIMPGA